jgi:hypothetical protein
MVSAMTCQYDPSATRGTQPNPLPGWERDAISTAALLCAFEGCLPYARAPHRWAAARRRRGVLPHPHARAPAPSTVEATTSGSTQAARAGYCFPFAVGIGFVADAAMTR